MKQRLNPVLSDKVVDELRLKCCICSKPIVGYFGGWQEGGTCNSVCEKKREAMPKFPGHSSEAFETLHNL